MILTATKLILALALVCFVSSCAGLRSSNQNVHVAFYGRVIDQNGSPMQDVKINATVRHWHEPDFFAFALGASFIHLTVKTDRDGRFRLHGGSGDVISFDYFQKEKYELEPGGCSFSPASGSFDSPVIFRMWPTNIHEHLITGEIKSKIIPDGRPYMIDLFKGTISESGTGNIKIWIKYAGQPEQGKLYEWSCEIDAMNGNLVEEPLGTAMYLAPTNGYAPSFQLQKQVNGGGRASSGARQFYINLKDGQEFGRITIELIAPFDNEVPGVIRLSYAINPSGSRVLY